MGNPAWDGGFAALTFARRTTLRLLEDIPEDKLTHQPAAGANHALWVLGHIAWADDFFLKKLDGRPSRLSPTWDRLFAMGSAPVGDAAVYPKFDAVKAEAAALREGLVAWFATMSDEKLAAPMPEGWTWFAPTYGSLISIVACHESMHAGQITVVRKSLGIKPVAG